MLLIFYRKVHFRELFSKFLNQHVPDFEIVVSFLKLWCMRVCGFSLQLANPASFAQSSFAGPSLTPEQDWTVHWL